MLFSGEREEHLETCRKLGEKTRALAALEREHTDRVAELLGDNEELLKQNATLEARLAEKEAELEQQHGYQAR